MKNMKSEELPDIINKVLTINGSLHDIGQISQPDLHILRKYAKKGFIDKAKAGVYPKLKTCYARKGFDFYAERQDAIKSVTAVYKYEKLNPII